MKRSEVTAPDYGYLGDLAGGCFSVCLVAGALLLGAGIAWVFWPSGRKQVFPGDGIRGFEVKQPTGGESPAVLREKDDHHG